MTYPTKEEVRSVLETYHHRIRDVVERSWDEIRAVAQLRAATGFAPLLYSRTTANSMFDAIARHAITEFGSDPIVKLKVEAQTIKLIFKGQVIARFKKGDANKLGRNVPTQSALAFADAAGVLPGLPAEAAKVEFIWMPDELKIRLGNVFVVARDGDRMLWNYEIDRGAAAGTVVDIPNPIGPRDDDGDDLLVTPKPIQRPAAK
jgi:hypothetical protein